MTLAKDLSATTLDFLLAQPGELDRAGALFACVAATAVDGSAKATREVLLYALGRGVPAAKLREVLLLLVPLAGAVRAQQALLLLGEAHDEAREPSDPFAVLLEPRARPRDEPDPGADDDSPPPGEARAALTLDEVHGERAARVRARYRLRSATLARWVEGDLYGRVFGRPGLAPGHRILAAIGATWPLDARPVLEDFVFAARAHGTSPAALWALSDLLARLFREGPEARNGALAFETVLGRRVRDPGPGF